MSKCEYEWFIESKDASTDDVIGKNIGEENYLKNVLCFDGKERNLWQCSSTRIWFLWCSRKGLKIKFKVFNVGIGCYNRIKGLLKDKKSHKKS